MLFAIIAAAGVAADPAQPASSARASLMPVQLRCERLRDPLGIDALSPRLGWQLRAQRQNARGLRQTGYRVVVAESLAALRAGRPVVWDTGRVRSDSQVDIEYAGPQLRSHQQLWWRVMVWDEQGRPSGWSTPGRWSMGVLSQAEWGASWIGRRPPSEPDQALPASEEWHHREAAPMLRREFVARGRVRSATVYVCGLGYHELSINGARVGDHELDPAFTRYDRRVLYATHDVTKLVRSGKNAIGIILGNGLYNQHARDAWDFERAPWRARSAAMVHLRIVHTDGSVTTVVTDGAWKAATGPILRDGIRNGEVYDARLERAGWNLPGYDDRGWEQVATVDGPAGVVSAQAVQPIRVTERIRPKSISEPRPGVYVVDIGQNIAGRARIRVQAPRGTRIRMVYAERLNPDGTVNQDRIKEHLREGAFQTEVYVAAGGGPETWASRFTFHGFQYVQIEGWPGKPTLDSLTAEVLQTDFAPIGSFACSNELLNTLWRLTQWSYRGNYVGIPMDCPHREKNGWTGDAQLASEFGLLAMDAAAPYEKWLRDLKDEQRPDGSLPGIVPTGGWGYHWGNGPAWDSAYLTIPWNLYLYTGDRRVLAEHYAGMRRYVDYLTSRANDGIVDFGLGDWLPADTQTPVAVTSTGYYFADARIVAEAAAVLGHQEDSSRYGKLAENIRDAFNRTFRKPDGSYANGSQTALSCALYHGLAPADGRDATLAKLVEAVDAREGRIDTGILGAKYLFRVLADHGRMDLAYRVATSAGRPSYAEWVRRGATTLWEDWDGHGSLNHIMFGDIAAWFVSYLGGIRPDPGHPGFERVILKPMPVAGLTSVSAAHAGVRGEVRSEWSIADGVFRWTVVVPPNCRAEAHVPLNGNTEVREGSVPVGGAAGVRVLDRHKATMVLELGSGRYVFSVPW